MVLSVLFISFLGRFIHYLKRTPGTELKCKPVLLQADKAMPYNCLCSISSTVGKIANVINKLHGNLTVYT